jgi:hypothetical protein
MKTLFLDESGHHDLNKIDPDYPVFVLAGAICDAEYAAGDLTQRLDEFKQSTFGTTRIILHTADIARAKNGFERLGCDSEFRREFYCRLNNLMASLDYTVVACAILKRRHVQRYGMYAADPYHFAVQPLVERFCYELGSACRGGHIIAECRRPDLDTQLVSAYEDIERNGTLFISGNKVRNRICGLTCIPKQQNVAGLQIADLVASPIGRYVIGKPIKPDFEIVRRKFRGGSMGFGGRGLIVLPKQ